MRMFAWFLVVISALALSSGCETWHGFGDDVSSVGGHISGK